MNTASIFVSPLAMTETADGALLAAVDSRGRIWLARENGDTATWMSYILLPGPIASPGPPETNPYSLVKAVSNVVFDDAGNLYVGSNTATVYQVDVATGQVRHAGVVHSDGSGRIERIAVNPATNGRPAALIAGSSRGSLAEFSLPMCEGEACSPVPPPCFSDACVAPPDRDYDGVMNLSDNCEVVPNPDQADSDLDGIGDRCDLDADGDAVNDDVDVCPATPLNTAVDATGCSLAQAVPCAGPAGEERGWLNTGEYIRAATAAALRFRTAGLISSAEYLSYVTSAARSSCGR